jgi:TonB family protein
MSLLVQDTLIDDYVIAAPVHSRLPRLDLGIDWVPRWEEFRTSLRDALTGPKPASDGPISGGADLSVEWIRTYRPGSTLFAAILCHAAAIWLITLPIWGFLPSTHAALAPVQIEMDWYVPADLPPILLASKSPKKKPQAAAEDSPKNNEPLRGADAFHPRQTILSVPVHLTHPRQTLIRPDALMKAPKVAQPLPNVVQWAVAEPQVKRPEIQYSTSRSAPEARKAQKNTLAAPQIANPAKTAASIDIAQTNAPHLAPPAPIPSMAKIAPRQITRHDPGAAPQIAAAKDPAAFNVAQANDMHLAPPLSVSSMATAIAPHRTVRQDAAPEVAGQANGGNPADVRRLIALSATPPPSAPEAPIPQGNLAANVSISPEGTKAGIPGGAEHGGTSGKAAAASGNADSMPAAISVSAANTNASNAGIARPGNLTPKLNLSSKPMVSAAASGGAPKTAPVNVATLPPGAAPEKLLSGEIGTLRVSTPNTTSTRGSWTLSFAQLGENSSPTNPPKENLGGPLPIRTVDPKYPPETMSEHITGEVVLYAIIRKDGSVDSIQLVRSLDPRLDKAAIDALAQWKFNPGTRAGQPVDLEAVIHVPFEYRQLNY